MMQELVVDTTPYNMGANRTPWIIIRTGIDGSTPYYSGSGNSDVASCTSPTVPSVFNWNGIIGNIQQTATPKFMETSELQTSNDRIFSNDYNAPSIGSRIIHDELSVSSRRDIYLSCRTNVAEETVQPMGPQLFIHGVPTIYTLNKNAGI